MSDSKTFKKNFYVYVKSAASTNNLKNYKSRKSLMMKFDKENIANKSIKKSSSKITNCDKNWYDAFSNFGKSNVYSKEAWKYGTEKIWQTLGNVRSTFGSFSQKVTQSSKQKQPLINVDSPSTTPYERSRAVLGRTPTKLYSPFDFDTPKKKEIISKKILTSPCKKNIKFNRKKYQEAEARSKQLPKNSWFLSEVLKPNESMETQIGIYEFHYIANKIVKIDSDN